MAKETTSFRVSDESKRKLTELSNLFRESNGEIIERAINLLYENRATQAKVDLENRLRNLENEKNK